MKHRIFIAINLPENIKKELANYQSKWPDLPVRWTKKENLHITLEFLGYLVDEELMELSQKTREIASKNKPFSIHLNKICYGPVQSSTKSKTPRMVWVMGNKIKEFNFVPHITLGRLRTWQWRQIEPEERPEVNEDIDLTFEVNSIEIMESVLKRTGPEYIILESVPLGRF
jgi:2'-5' RNA ligase